MKKTFAERCLRSMLAMFFVAVGLFGFATSGEAQTINQGPAQAINWKPESEAIQGAKGQVMNYAPQLASAIPGTVQYNNLLARVLFYKNVTAALMDGSSVATAVDSSLPVAARLGGADHTSPVLSRAEMGIIYNEALNGILAN